MTGTSAHTLPGPWKVLTIHDQSAGLDAVVVVDNVACGPAIGGVRMASDATADECRRLARAMTLKNAAAGLPHGGGKSVIIADPHAPPPERERRIRAFAHAIRDMTEYIPGPDMGTDETAMAWIIDEGGRAVGLPRVLGGIPLDELGATGLGVSVATEVACEHLGRPLKGARVAVQGFGAVGHHAARFLVERGAIVVGVSDRRGAIVDPRGLDVAALARHKASGKPVSAFPGGSAIPGDDLVGVACDIWIPAARPDAIHEGNVDRLTARIVVEGANIPTTPAAEAALLARGVLVVPDFIANAGGVITASVEYHGGSEAAAATAVRERISSNTSEVLKSVSRTGSPRAAAELLAIDRLRRASAIRRFG